MTTSDDNDGIRYLYEQVSRFYLWKGYLKILDNLNTTGLIDADGFDLRGIGHNRRQLLRLSSRESHAGDISADLISMHDVMADLFTAISKT